MFIKESGQHHFDHIFQAFPPPPPPPPLSPFSPFFVGLVTQQKNFLIT